MIIDARLASEVSENASLSERATASLLRFIEKKLNVFVIRDTRKNQVDYGMLEPLRLAAILKDHGIIKKINRDLILPDEPRTKSWRAICNDQANNEVRGTTFESDSDALYATLAEALERYIWLTQTDYFVRPIRVTTSGIEKMGQFVSPDRFAGFSEEQRAKNSERQLRKNAEYLWIQGFSLTKEKNIYLPAQVVSGASLQNERRADKEPVIRQTTTNGLATWSTQTGARLAGVNEIIEREAYMIMWLNQLTLSRISLQPLCSVNPPLSRSIELCERFRLKTHVIRLLTDAPTHAIAVIMEDLSGLLPRFTIGLKAHRSLTLAIQKAMTEALRARLGCRRWFGAGNTWDMNVMVGDIGHRERLYYWSIPEHAKKLEFMMQGPETEIELRPWDNDNEEDHMGRITKWCAEKDLECVSVSLGSSSANPTSLCVEMVVIPELQPAYLTESAQAFGGTRWRDIPTAFGYKPLPKPFADRPHPFS